MPKPPISQQQWDKARAAYESGLYPITEIAKAHGVSYLALRKRIDREGWIRTKRNVDRALSTAVMSRTREKVVEKLAEANVRALDLAEATCDNLIRAIHEASQDPAMWRRHVVVVEERTRTRSGDTKVHRDSESREMDTLNGQNILNTAKALRELKTLKRLIEGVMSAYEAEMVRVAAERLALDNKKAGVGEEIESETGVAEIPATDWSLLDRAVPDPGGQTGGSGA